MEIRTGLEWKDPREIISGSSPYTHVTPLDLQRAPVDRKINKYCLKLCMVWTKKKRLIVNLRVRPCLNVSGVSVASEKSQCGLDVSNIIL